MWSTPKGERSTSLVSGACSVGPMGGGIERQSGPELAPSLISCVVDTDSHFQLELLRWFATATKCAGIAPERLVVHAVRPGESEVLQYVADRGARVVPVERFDPRSPHCNKISGALALAASLTGDAGAVALTDTDMLVMADPTGLVSASGRLSGKTVDLANPSLETLEVIFREARLPLPARHGDRYPTVEGNFNGGLYALAGSDLLVLANAWERWARWLLERPGLLGEFAIHVDQVAMCLARVDAELEADLLDVSWNLPTHLEAMVPAPFVPVPRLIHYHRRLTSDGFVEEVGIPTVDASIRKANRAIHDQMQEFFPSASFWSWQGRQEPTSAPVS